MFNQSKGNTQENGRGQAKGQNQIRVQEVPKGRQVRGQGRQNGQAGWYRVHNNNQSKGQNQKPKLEKGEKAKQENGKKHW